MLIFCDRIKPEDLVLWKAYEEYDSYHFVSSYKLKQAISKLRLFTEKKKCYCGLSWGKDSVALAHIIYMNNIKIPFVHLYCIPSHNPYCDIVRDYFLRNFKIEYHEIIVDYGSIYSSNLSDYEQDKATDKLFFEGFIKAEKQFGEAHISGIRQEESSSRRLKMMKYGISTERTSTPIGYWKTQDIFSYLYHNDLPIHPNYAMLGGGRWDRNYIRVAEIGDIHGNGMGRTEWEREYYSDIINHLKKKNYNGADL